MNIFIAALLLASLTCIAAVAPHPDVAMLKSFESFKRTYGRNYTSAAEERLRLRIFIANAHRAAEQQKRNPLARFGVTEFSDMSPDEFAASMLADLSDLQQRRNATLTPAIFSDAEIQAASSSIDWRTYGAVTYVKNQLNCGGCWSFSSTGSIEGQWVIAGQQSLVALSEQNLISCDTNDNGCHGGTMDNAWSWLVSAQNGEIATEDSYPFVSGNGSVPVCSSNGTTVGATITGHQDLPQNEQQMATWMDNNGPISIAVDATSFHSYQGGIITNCITQKLNHAVLTVGYNAEGSTPYWIVKNSWGPEFGEDGYVYVQMYSNECLIANAPCTSVVGSSNDWHMKKRPAQKP